MLGDISMADNIYIVTGYTDMRILEDLITVLGKRYIKNSCCMQLDGISTNTTIFFIIKSENLKEKRTESSLEKCRKAFLCARK